MSVRKILHLDLDAFFCAVEELIQPELRGKAFAVGGSPEHRGVIASCSYAARMYGVHSAMPTRKAKSLCPELILVSSGFSNYQKASREVMAILGERTALVEQISIDEAFLDLSDLPEAAEDQARVLQNIIFRKVGLPCSIGVAGNKLVAKIANDVGKQKHRGSEPPMAITVVKPGDEAEFLSPLPVNYLWGIGPKTAVKLNKMGITTIGDISRMPKKQLEQHFGQNGAELLLHAKGIDTRLVQVEHEIKSISKETTFDRDLSDEVFLINTLRELCGQVCLRLRKNGLCGSTLKLKVRWPDFETITRQITMTDPTDQDEVVFKALQKIFLENWKQGRKVRLLGVGVSGLSSGEKQLSLWETPEAKEDRLLKALDDIHTRYGNKSVRRAIDLDKKG